MAVEPAADVLRDRVDIAPGVEPSPIDVIRLRDLGMTVEPAANVVRDRIDAAPGVEPRAE